MVGIDMLEDVIVGIGGETMDGANIDVLDALARAASLSNLR